MFVECVLCDLFLFPFFLFLITKSTKYTQHHSNMVDAFSLNFPSIPPLQDEDDYTPLQKIDEHIVDSARGCSLEQKLKSAFNHINYALNNHIDGYKNKTLDDIPLESFNNDLAGKIGTYFAKYARKRLSPDAPLVSLSTAVNYMSAFKSFFVDKFR